MNYAPLKYNQSGGAIYTQGLCANWHRIGSPRTFEVPLRTNSPRIVRQENRLNQRQLEIFSAVIREGSASRAAELLHLSQPAVSLSLAELESTLGFALFDRVRGRLVPTVAGQMFHRDVAASFTGLERLRSAARRIQEFGSGSIRIASLAALGSTVVPRAIRSFQRNHPEIAISLEIHSSAKVRELVADQQVDLGLAAEEADLSGIEHSVFASFRAVCVMPAGHALAAKPVIRPADLHEVAFIALSPEDRTRAQITRALDAVGARPRVMVETPGASTICALALAGVGVGIVNPAAADGFAERGLVFREFEPAVQFRSYLLFRTHEQKAQLVRKFMGELMKARRLPLRPAA
jgi:DNA-binding transcriptional LysR family regulator